MADRNNQLEQAEADFAEAVALALTETADEFADAVQDATELVAARFSVGRISRMWGNRVTGLVRRLLGTAETAAVAAAEDVDAELPDGWDDLPGRYDDDTLPEGIGQYVTTTEHLLHAVGDRLAEVARAELAAGVDAGEDLDQLRARLRAAFSREGAELGPVRERRIAQSEATRAWNMATLAAAQAATGPDRPVVKQWITRHDARVRSAHDEVDGQIRLLAEPFTVAGVDMQAPGDPTAPPGLVIHCRCRLGVAPELQAAAMESQVGPAAELSDRREDRVEVAQPVTAAADGSHLQGAMIALVPTQGDAAHLAIEGGESAEELHLTLFFLGNNGDDWTEEQRDELIGNVRAAAEGIDGAVTARAFGANHWNPDSDSPSWVWAIGDDRDRDPDAPTLDTVHHAVTYAVEDTHERPELPIQHSPWQPHVAAIYSEEPWPLDALVERLGPVTFDRIRVAFAGEHTDISLGTQEEPMPETTAAGLPARPWSTPDDTAIAFENQQTGDGRIFSAGALYWSGPGPWPLQYADEMLMGHQGAELAGAIQEIGRNGDRITSSGVLYSTRYAGQDAITLLEEDAPLGISVDLDDVDVEFVQVNNKESGQVDIASAKMSACPQCTTTASAEVASGSTANSRTQNAVSAAAADDSNPARSVSSIWTRDGFTRPATRSSIDAGNFPATPASTAGNPSNPARQSSAQDAADTRPSGPTGLKSAGTTSVVPTGSPQLQQSASSQSKAASAPSAAWASPSSTPTPTGTRPTSTTAMAADATERSSVSPVTQGSGTSRTTPDFSNVQPRTCVCTRTDDVEQVVLAASLASLSVLRLDDGAFMLSASTDAGWTASGGIPSRNRFDVQLITGPGGQVSGEGLRAAFAGTSVLTAAAGDPDDDTGLVVHSESSGDFLVRITRARLRGATLVAMPAYDRARIVLDPIEESQEPLAVAAAASVAAATGDTHQRVVAHVCSSPVAVGAREVATAVEISMSTARGHLVRAVKAGRLVRLAPGLYVGPSTLPEGEAVASADDGQGDDSDELVASAWTAMRDTDPMPAAWFQEPMEDELPPGSGGVHYSGGRVFGWVAQAGEPHAGYPGRNLTIESLGKLDLSHFLRAHFRLDDGSTVRAGAFTMNAGHHRDGAECETSSCQFDDTRTVAGIVTVGMNERGLWFSGAAAPWLSEWDRQVFQACQPSYHMKQGGDGRWQLRAVLSVPVPGHSSPLLASTIAERSNLALAASAADALTAPDTLSGQMPDNSAEASTDTAPDLPGQRPDTTPGHHPDSVSAQPAIDVEHLAAALLEGPFIDGFLAAMDRREADRRAEIDQLAASIALTPEEITASANPKGAN